MTTIHRLSNDQYAQLFNENSRVELVAGIVYDKINVGDDHVRAVDRLNELFSCLWGQYIISIQSPIKWDDNEPEPDVAIYRPCERRTPQHCELVIEVADSTLHHDRTVKVPAYNSQGLEAWIVNLPLQKIEIYRPSDTVEVVTRAEAFGVTVTIEDLA